MNSYLLQLLAADRAQSMRTAAATTRLARQARRTGQASPRNARDLLHAIPRQRESEESVARRAA